ncbi:MAG TPA: glycosyltransferase 87 family protein, partial [Candidatus Binatia bacterium]|nr:glycosyltransferase 87 family protein [Candidatus Binatia bacterium]
WLGGRRSLSLLAFPPVALELYHGNIHLLMAAAVVIGFRHPSAWAFILLTKVTPGIGLLWFLVRREWRALATAIVVTVTVVLVSLAVDGRLWLAWLSESLFATATGAPLNQFEIPVPLPFRILMAAAVVAWEHVPTAAGRSRWPLPWHYPSCGRPGSPSSPPSGG